MKNQPVRPHAPSSQIDREAEASANDTAPRCCRLPDPIVELLAGADRVSALRRPPPLARFSRSARVARWCVRVGRAAPTVFPVSGAGSPIAPAGCTPEHKGPRAPDPNRKHKPQSVHVQPRRTDSADWGRRKLGE